MEENEKLADEVQATPEAVEETQTPAAEETTAVEETPVAEEAVIEALDSALEYGYVEGYEDAISDTPEIDFMPESTSLDDTWNLN